MNDAARGYRRIDDADLRARNSFGIAARAPVLIEVDNADALPEIFAQGLALPGSMILGGGSNLLFAGNPETPVIALGGADLRVVRDEGDIVVVRAAAGAPWHDFVMWTLAQGLCGLENLALIPGTVGAAPIQNIGAYGVEVRDAIHAVEAYDRKRGRTTRFDAQACAFDYRDSRFKREPDAWIVTAVEFVLSRNPVLRLDYVGVGDELAQMGVDAPTPADVAQAVIHLRQRKLPDPARIGNAGSFFKNPIVPAAFAEDLRSNHAQAPVFRAGHDQARKLSAAWLIDQCGWKGHRDGDAGVSDRHALVLVNHGNASGAQLLDLARRIAASVHERFGVAIEPEPRIVGAIW